MIEKNHEVRCSHIEEHQCRKRAIYFDKPFLQCGPPKPCYHGQHTSECKIVRRTSEYCLEHHAEHYFGASETLSYYCSECPEQAEPMVVRSKRLELLHSKEEGIWGDFKDGEISSDSGLFCPEHGGSRDSFRELLTRKDVVFVRNDCDFIVEE